MDAMLERASGAREGAPATPAGDVRARVDALLTRYARCLDDRRLDEWPELFADDGTYEIRTRDNYARGLPLPLMLCQGRGMLKDRAYAFLHINVTPRRVERHLLANVRVEPRAAGVYAVEADYAVFQTDATGLSAVFSVGRYLDTVVEDDGELKFRTKLVVSDTCVVTTALSGPI